MSEHTLPQHFLVSEADGALYDTRKPAWHTLPPLRPNYSRHHRLINSVADVKACLRAGEFTFPGGYRLAFVTLDGGVLSFDSARECLGQVIWDIDHACSTGWLISGLLCVDECDDDVICDHSNEILNGDRN
jgi:hypothetical protein